MRHIIVLLITLVILIAQAQNVAAQNRYYHNVPNVPEDTLLVVQLENFISSRSNQVGDAFRCRVLQPSIYKNAIIVGEVTHVKAAGKFSRDAELGLFFSYIAMPNANPIRIVAQVNEVYNQPELLIKDLRVEEADIKTRKRSKWEKVGGFFKGLFGIKGKDITLPCNTKILLITGGQIDE